ncbi:N-6 DNA methylase [Zhongshania marina]|tara:strand:- start:632 stop:1708 length:1077 start_codon:yes stop_codon:yes gene_type:complete
MDIDLDRYYTPLNLAEGLIADQFEPEIKICVDTTCGSGNLLRAANNVFGKISCIGLDRDKSAITKLRRQQPEWQLSVADMLNRKSYQKTYVASLALAAQSDLLLLNPPFSLGNKKSVPVTYGGVEIKASIAMAHVLKSFELFKPKTGALIIVPESVLYSETDEIARNLLLSQYSLEIVTELHNTTFSGARVHSSVITLRPGTRIIKNRISRKNANENLTTSLIRGGLPQYKLVKSFEDEAIPFVHTTTISKIKSGGLQDCDRTEQKLSGRITGPVVFLPRVGLPCSSNIYALNLKYDVQLSDCVIALHFENFISARRASKILTENYESLLALYRGTGARYITLRRLKVWLTENGFKVN